MIEIFVIIRRKLHKNMKVMKLTYLVIPDVGKILGKILTSLCLRCVQLCVIGNYAP